MSVGLRDGGDQASYGGGDTFWGRRAFRMASCKCGHPPPTPVVDALVDFEIGEVEGGYILEWFSCNTSHHGDSWHETLEDALEQARTEFGVRPEEWCSVRCGS